MAEAPRPTPAQIAAAWRAFRGDRPGMTLGPGPAFVEALTAAMVLDPRVAELEAEVERLTKLAEVPRGLYLALADAAPGLWHGGHRCDGAIVVGSPAERVTIGQDMPAADAHAAAEAVNFVRRLDAGWRGRTTEREKIHDTVTR